MADETRTIKIVVFLNEDERTRFKIACAKNQTNMSTQARELILNWIDEQK
jgi:hypothetical protein